MKRIILSFLMVMTLFGSASGMDENTAWYLEQNKEFTPVDASEFNAYLDSTMSQELKDLLAISGRTSGSTQGHVYKAIRALADEENDPAAQYMLGANPGNKDLLKRSAALGYFPAKVALAQLLTDDEADERFRLLGEIAQGAKYPGHETYTLRHAPSEKKFEQLQAARYKILSALQAPSNPIFDTSAYHKLELLNDQEDVSAALEITQQKDQPIEKYRHTLATMTTDPRSDYYIDENRYATKENFIKELSDLAAAFTNHTDTKPIDRQTRIRAINALRFITIKPWLTSDDVQTSLKKLIQLADLQFPANQRDASLSSYEHFKALVQAKMAANSDIAVELDELIAAFKNPSDLATRIRAINALRGISSNSSLLPKLKELIQLADSQFAAAGNDLDSRSYKRRYEFYRDPILKALATPQTDVGPMAAAAVQQPMETSPASMPQSSEVTPVADSKRNDSAQSVVIKDIPKAARDFKIVTSDLKEKLEKVDTNTNHIQDIIDEIKAHNVSDSWSSLEKQDLQHMGTMILKKLRAQKLKKEAAKYLIETIVVPQPHQEVTVPFGELLLEVYGSSESLGLTQDTLAKIEETLTQMSAEDATTILNDMRNRSYQDQDGVFKTGLLFAKQYVNVNVRSKEFRSYIFALAELLTTPSDLKKYEELVTMGKAIALYQEYCASASIQDPNRYDLSSRQFNNSIKNGKLTTRLEKLEEAYRLFPAFFANDATSLITMALSPLLDEKNKKIDSKTALSKAFTYFEAVGRCDISAKTNDINSYRKGFIHNNFDRICTKKYISGTAHILLDLVGINPSLVQEIFSVPGRLDTFEKIAKDESNEAAKIFLSRYYKHIHGKSVSEITEKYYANLSNNGISYERVLSDIRAIIEDRSKIIQKIETLDDYRFYQKLLLFAQKNTSQNMLDQEKEWGSIKQAFDTTLAEIQKAGNELSPRITKLYSHLDAVYVRSQKDSVMQEKILQLMDTIIAQSAHIQGPYLRDIYKIRAQSLPYCSDACYKPLLQKMVKDVQDIKTIRFHKSLIITLVTNALNEQCETYTTKQETISKLVTAMTEKKFDTAVIESRRAEQAALVQRIASTENAIKELTKLQGQK